MGRKKIEINESDIVNYIIKNKASLRETASHFGVGKDLIRNRLKKYVGIHKEEIEEILQDNLKNSRF